MAHLAVDPCLLLAIEMHKRVLGIIIVEPVRISRTIMVAKDVDHCGSRIEHLGRPQRQIGDGAQVLGELRGLARLDRKMTQVVRTGRDLIEPDFAVSIQKELEAEDAYTLQKTNRAAGDLARRVL